MSITTLQFLQLIVPEQGEKFISIDRGNRRWTDIYAGETHQEMVDTLRQYQNKPLNIYHANATFNDADVGRKAINAAYIKALWLDLDVQKETGESYASQQDALAAAKQFVKARGLPKPSLVVSSGKGIHLYWCFDDAISADRWHPLAQAFKALTKTHGLLTDLTVIADKARVLRPIGTEWVDVKTDSGERRPVRLLWANPTLTLPVETLEGLLLGEAAEPLPAKLSADARYNDNLSMPKDADAFAGSDPLKIARLCGQIGRFQQSGDLPYEIWRLCVGVLVRANDGARLVHEWSANGYAHYTYEDTQAKIDTWNVQGATRCATFREKDGNDSPCSTCTQRCNSPIALGYGGGAQSTKYRDPTGEDTVFEPATFPDDARILPNGTLQVQMIRNIGTRGDPDWQPVWEECAKQPFYLTNLAVKDDGRLESDVVFFPRENQIKGFILPHELIKDHRNLGKLMAAFGVHGQGPQMEKFIVSYIELLKRHVDDTLTYQQMGWIGKRKEFLIGDTVISPDTLKKVRVSHHMSSRADLFDHSKDPKEWTHAVNKLYNLPHGQPYQFALCAAFGSALVPILGAEEYNGIPIALTSDESGYGKSTVCKIALAAFGQVARNKNVLTGDEVSTGAVEVQCSTFNNVPHLFDEMTNKGAQETSHILYMLSNGVARARLKQDGTPRPASPPWCGMSFITGNKNIFLKLTESRVNPEAAQMRVFEIPLENYPRLESLRHAADFIELTNSVRSGYGAVALSFIRFTMTHRAKIEKQLWQAVNELSKREGVRHGKERFYIYTIACTVIAGKILRHLGLVDFDIGKMYEWAFMHMASLRDTTNEYQRNAEEDFSLMLANIVGEGRAISTCFESATGSEIPMRGVPVLRIIRDTEFAALTLEGFNRYCLSVSKSPAKFKQELIDAGCFDERFVIRHGDQVQVDTIDVSLGQGVPGLALGTSKCYRLNFQKAIGPISTSLDRLPENVLAFNK